MNKKLLLITLLSLLAILSCPKYRSTFPPPVQKSEDIIVFENVNLVPMTDDKIVKNQTVLIKGSRIIKIGPSKTIAMP